MNFCCSNLSLTHPIARSARPCLVPSKKLLKQLSNSTSTLAIYCSKMPVEGLPSSLEAMLSMLLTENSVTSFKVEANANKTVVVLRFASTTGGQDGAATTQSSAAFKRKSASQIERDRRRAETFQQQHQQQQEQQQPQPPRQLQQASQTEIQELSLPTSTVFTSAIPSLGLPSSAVVNTPRRRPISSRANHVMHGNTQQQPAHSTDGLTHVRASTNSTPQECASKQRTVSSDCGGGGGGGGDNKTDEGDVTPSQAAVLRTSITQLLEQCTHVSSQHRQMLQLQQQQQQELASMCGTDRPPPSRYQLRSHRNL